MLSLNKGDYVGARNAVEQLIRLVEHEESPDPWVAKDLRLRLQDYDRILDRPNADQENVVKLRREVERIVGLRDSGRAQDALKSARAVVVERRRLYPLEAYPEGHPAIADDLGRLGNDLGRLGTTWDDSGTTQGRLGDGLATMPA